MIRITTAASNELRADPRRAQLRRPHRPGAARRRGRRHQFRRELDQHRSRRSTTTRPRGSPGGRRRLSRALPRRADLPEGADPGGADRLERGDRRPHLRPRLTILREQGRRGQGRSSRRSTASSICTSSSRTTSRRSKSRSTSTRRRRYGIKPGDVRRAAGHPDAGRGGRRHLPATARPTTSTSGARPTTADEPRRHSATC